MEKVPKFAVQYKISTSTHIPYPEPTLLRMESEADACPNVAEVDNFIAGNCGATYEQLVPDAQQASDQ